MVFYICAAVVAAALLTAISYCDCRALATDGFDNAAYLERFAREGIRSYWLLLVMAVAFVAIVSAFPVLPGAWQVLLPLIGLAALVVCGAIYVRRARWAADPARPALRGRFAVAAGMAVLVCVGGYFAGVGILAAALLVAPLFAPAANAVCKLFRR